EGVDADLTFVGRMVWLPDADRQKLEELRRHPRFEWLTDRTDEQVRDLIRDSRATVCPSLGEGYGIPPLESLALGVPVIATASIPSLGMISPHGQVRLAEPDSGSIRRAVRELLDDDFARRKYREIAALRLPSWS